MDELLKMRGDAAITLLKSLRERMQRDIAVIDKAIADLAELDKQFNLSTEGEDVQSNILAAVRKSMPHLADKSDAEIIAMFAGAKP